jgi:hypothetical protein
MNRRISQGYVLEQILYAPERNGGKRYTFYFLKLILPIEI